MFAKAVLGLDASESSDRALAHAAAFAKQEGTKLHVVHVIEILVGRAAGPLHLDETERKEKISAQVAELRNMGLDVELEMHPAVTGGPAQVLVEAADRVGADVIIIGTRGQCGRRRTPRGERHPAPAAHRSLPAARVPATAPQIAIELAHGSTALPTG